MIYTQTSIQRAIEKGRTFSYYCYGEYQLDTLETCLSNSYPAEFCIDTLKWYSVEQFINAQKASLANDFILYNKVVTECRDNPVQAIKYGSKVSTLDKRLWDRLSLAVIYRGMLGKFTQNEKLKDYLLSTGDSILVCTEYYNDTWGVKLKLGDKKLEDPSQWRGANQVGFLLMQVRDFLKTGNA